MVFGNLGDDCATGVAFTRNPATGGKIFYGEFLINAQGEDVVAGIRTPRPIAELKKVMPRPYARTSKGLQVPRDALQGHAGYRIHDGGQQALDASDSRGKRTGFAAVRIAVDMVEERIISKKEALLRVEADHLNQLLRPIFDS